MSKAQRTLRMVAAALVGMAGWSLLPAAAPPAAAAPPGYYPSGPQLAVVGTALSSWNVCYSGIFNADAVVSTIARQCDKAYLMLAARPLDASTFTVLAAARRADVFSTNGTVGNGSRWYSTGALGFAGGTDALDLAGGCDAGDRAGGGAFADADRLCLGVIEGNVLKGSTGRVGTVGDPGTRYEWWILEASEAPDEPPPLGLPSWCEGPGGNVDPVSVRSAGVRAAADTAYCSLPAATASVACATSSIDVVLTYGGGILGPVSLTISVTSPAAGSRPAFSVSSVVPKDGQRVVSVPVDEDGTRTITVQAPETAPVTFTRTVSCVADPTTTTTTVPPTTTTSTTVPPTTTTSEPPTSTTEPPTTSTTLGSTVVSQPTTTVPSGGVLTTTALSPEGEPPVAVDPDRPQQLPRTGGPHARLGLIGLGLVLCGLGMRLAPRHPS